MLKPAFEFIHIAFDFVQKRGLFEFIREYLNMCIEKMAGNEGQKKKKKKKKKKKTKKSGQNRTNDRLLF